MRELIQQVQGVLGEIDLGTARFADASGLACPSGCGQCCENPAVETTVLECLPLAYWLLTRPEGPDEALARLELNRGGAGPHPCVFYAATPGSPAGFGQGRCTVYEHRPGLCRLFGFAARLDRRGLSEPVICRIHRQTLPEAVARAQTLADSGAPIPNFYEFATRFALLEPQLGTQQLPINEAIRQAIHKLGLWMTLEQQI